MEDGRKRKKEERKGRRIYHTFVCKELKFLKHNLGQTKRNGFERRLEVGQHSLLRFGPIDIVYRIRVFPKFLFFGFILEFRNALHNS